MKGYPLSARPTHMKKIAALPSITYTRPNYFIHIIIHITLNYFPVYQDYKASPTAVVTELSQKPCYNQ